MKYFTVTVLARGQKSDYGFYAESKKEAHYLGKIKYTGIILKVVESSPPLEDQIARLKNNVFKNMKKKKLKQDALIAAVRQLAVMTNAGISVHDALSELANSTDDENLKEILSTIAEYINSGQSLSNAMENFRFQLGNLTLAMVQLGEKTGNMAESLYTLANMLEEIRKNIIKFKKAMAYPRNVMVAMAIAFTILISYVVPKFKSIFAKLGADLPLPTLILLKMEELINGYGLYLIAGIILFVVIFKYLNNNVEEFKYRFHQVLNKTYLIKNIILYSTLNRFTLVFSELVHAGIPIAEALDTTIAMIDNLPLKDKLLVIRQTVEKGGTLHEGLEETGIFENMIIQMIKAGESGGQLDAMLKNVTDYYKMKFDAIIDGLSEAIEPIMLALIAGLVILLALGIFLPMWDMGSAVKGKH